MEVGTPNIQDVDVVATDADTDTLTYSITSEVIYSEFEVATRLLIATSAGDLNGRLSFTLNLIMKLKHLFQEQ